MVDGYLGRLTTEHRMLIHLFDNILPNNQWEAPVALPDTENSYSWNEETQQWDLNE